MYGFLSTEFCTSPLWSLQYFVLGIKGNWLT
jgi:hypothetical protein